MLDVVAARNTQKMVSGVDYRKYLHQWICLPDMQVYVHARKVNEQLSDVSKCFIYSILLLFAFAHIVFDSVYFKVYICSHWAVFWITEWLNYRMQCTAVLLVYTWITNVLWDVVIKIKLEQL